MNIFHAVLLGIIEGVTEFLPVSSTFHLIWTSKLLHLADTDFLKLFEVVIQPGAILAVLLIYMKSLLGNRKLLINLLYSFIPTAIVGLVLYKVIKSFFFENMFLQLGVFALVGVLFILFEKKWSKKLPSRNLTTMKPMEAILVGVIQSFAVVPGVSRAGAVILAMMGKGFSREESTRYSFLLAVPTIVAAGGYDLLKMRHTLLSSSANLALLLTGFIVSFVAAYVVVSWFLKYVKTHSMIGFGVYRIVLALVLLVLLGIGLR